MINLFINFFDHADPDRKKELEYCLSKNEKNKHIDNIFIVGRNRRPKLSEFFQAMYKYPDDVNIIANTDIYFDDTIKLANQINKKEVFALTRWEKVHNNVVTFNDRHGRRIPAQWSQDAWIFRGSVPHTWFDSVLAIRGSTRKSETIPFTLGIPGCDNKLAAILTQKGYGVSNPSLSIKAIHVHANDDRSYPDFQILHGIKPHGLVYQIAL